MTPPSIYLHFADKNELIFANAAFSHHFEAVQRCIDRGAFPKTC